MAPSGRVIEVGGVDWHRLGDGDSEADRQAGVLDLLRRAQRELGGGPLTGTRFLYHARDMLAATREIEAAVRGADTTLFVGFQRAEKLDGEAADLPRPGRRRGQGGRLRHRGAGSRFPAWTGCGSPRTRRPSRTSGCW